MRPPAFWRHGGSPHAILLPLAAVFAAVTARRVTRSGWHCGVPVICCGNPGAGGSGKTPLALDLAERLRARGEVPGFLTRGHGGALKGPIRVDPLLHDAAAAGDEALLLAQSAATYLGSDRADSARLAIEDGCTVLVMDDGLQNPSLAKTLSFLVVDGGAGFGNGRVIPAGPLREPVAAAAARCQAAVIIGADRTSARAALPASLPVLAARIVADEADLAALPPRILAFAGIGRPEKFFETLRAAGHAPLETLEFADHHNYTGGEIERLRRRAMALDAAAVTTAKDLMRLPLPQRDGFSALRIRLEWADPAAIEALLTRTLAR